MKIAVTARGEKKTSEVDSRFGRARYFIVFDTDTGEFKSIDNEINLNAIQGAGIQAGETVTGEEVDILLTGHCGPKAFRTLSAAGIKVVTGASGTVDDVIKRYMEGELKEVDAPDVEGHWS